MKKLNNIFTLLLVSILISGLCAGIKDAEASSTKNKVIKLTFANVTSNSCDFSGELFKKIVEKKTGGAIIVNLFPDNQLGDDRSVIEATQFGDIDIAVTSSSSIASMYKDFYAFDAPFIFNGEEDAYKKLDGPIGQAILDGMSKVGLKGLGYWENGMLWVANTKTRAASTDEMKGLKIRCMENDVYLSVFKAFNSNPTPMAFGEVFTALQQGTIDGVTTTLGAIYTNHFMDVQKYITGLKYAYLPYVICMNIDRYKSLTTEQQAIIDQAAKESIALNRKKSQELEAEYIAEYEANDKITVVFPTNEEITALKQAVIDNGVYDIARSRLDHPEYLDAFLK